MRIVEREGRRVGPVIVLRDLRNGVCLARSVRGEQLLRLPFQLIQIGMLAARPEIVNMDASGGDEHRALHHAVLARAADMVRLLMAHGADARIGIYPHRVPTTALAIATERGYDEIATIIREAEAQRPGFRGAVSTDSAPAMPPELQAAINRADARAAIEWLE